MAPAGAAYPRVCCVSRRLRPGAPHHAAPAAKPWDLETGFTGGASAEVGSWHAASERLAHHSGGRSDASHVLDPNQFSDRDIRHAYWVATQIPEVLNQLYCWCGCENRGVHRSNLQCFEDRMATDCAVCVGTAEIAFQMTQNGVRDAAKIQAAVDAKWAPKG